MPEVSQYLTDTEEKEILEQERQSLLQFKKDVEEMLNLSLMDDIFKFKRNCIEEHPKMSKEELLFRFQIIDDLYHFLKNYK